MGNMILQDKIKSFPRSPGVYLMKDKQGRIIYVGKAKDLRQRVNNYFGNHDNRYQVDFLMKRLDDIDFLQTNNEKEALLLENSLIKKHKPRYNVFLKDDKTYQGLKITMKDGFPRLMTTRKIKKDGSIYYGPFTSSDALYRVQAFIDHFFQLRTCSDAEFNNRTRPCLEYQIKRCSAPCVGYVTESQYREQIEAVKLFLDGKNKDLQKSIKKKMLEAADQEKFEEASRLRDLLKSMDSVLEAQKVTRLSFDFVDVLALHRDGEKVGVAVLMVRDGMLIDSKFHVLHGLEDDDHLLQNFITQYYSAHSFIPREVWLPLLLSDEKLLSDLLTERAGYKVYVTRPQRGQGKSLLELAEKNILSHMIQHQKKMADKQSILEDLKNLLELDKFPHRMECFDVSNISGKFAVASMVIFLDGEKFSDGYRRFKIKSIDTPNDYRMMYECLSRRFQHQEDFWAWPDLLVIDGGKGQLNVAYKVLQELNVTGVSLISIAKGKGEGVRAKGIWQGKKDEEVYLVGRKNPVKLKTGSPELMILQNLRDESHRFAINYHRKLREHDLVKERKKK
jgi:excinuclease ABC subunit C